MNLSTDQRGNVDLTTPQFCHECGYVHIPWISCYGAAKNRWEKENGRDFWTNEPIRKVRDA